MALPAIETAHERIYGPKRPPKPPRRSTILARHGARRVIANRTRTRWWYIESAGEYLVNFASTASARVAQGWLDHLSDEQEDPNECQPREQNSQP